jgi:hypothetical protein
VTITWFPNAPLSCDSLVPIGAHPVGVLADIDRDALVHSDKLIVYVMYDAPDVSAPTLPRSFIGTPQGAAMGGDGALMARPCGAFRHPRTHKPWLLYEVDANKPAEA